MTTDKNFAAILKLDEDGNKVIDRVGQTSSTWFMEECEKAGFGNYVFSDFMEYVIGERIDYYVNGKRMTDYEIWLKFGTIGLDNSNMMKFNDQGVKVKKSDKELILEGISLLPEGYQIVGNEVKPIPYWRIIKEYNQAQTKEDKYKVIVDKMGTLYHWLIQVIRVNMKGAVYTFDLESFNILMDLVNLNLPVEWKDQDNKVHSLTHEDAVALAKAVSQKKQELIKKLWDAKAEVKNMINNDEPIENILKLYAYYEQWNPNSNNDYYILQESDIFNTKTSVLEEISIPDESPYSGLVDKTEIKKLRTKKGAKSKKLDSTLSSTDDLNLDNRDANSSSTVGLNDNGEYSNIPTTQQTS